MIKGMFISSLLLFDEYSRCAHHNHFCAFRYGYRRAEPRRRLWNWRLYCGWPVHVNQNILIVSTVKNGAKSWCLFSGSGNLRDGAVFVEWMNRHFTRASAATKWAANDRNTVVANCYWCSCSEIVRASAVAILVNVWLLEHHDRNGNAINNARCSLKQQWQHQACHRTVVCLFKHIWHPQSTNEICCL